ncbi:type III-B CRISPR module RAMP protein Cmr4 [Tindallia californiensis]|uniref:CRISPR-associated protein Cmr4 n=1 Tax=Tindallia californiensis TaxID=159292 RepID=A0A1H3PQ36_9FIRM|nr:type III-B CRISPR module RAMP protein Cmr4 [Tindallia californiensis]SDZ03071.1 CRISPR-associated protein Cmr4 [Tindallia californiensis]
MYTKKSPFFIQCISSVHAGSGSEVGIVDLPIQREKHTGFPKIDSSSLKGAIRSVVEENAKEKESFQKSQLVFGSEPKASSDETNAGAIAFSDARILFFPIKSAKGVFVWATCPAVIKRFFMEMEMYVPEWEGVKVIQKIEPNTVSSEKVCVTDGKMVLEEYTFQVSTNEELQGWANTMNDLIMKGFDSDLGERVVVLEDDDFADFVKLSTEVNARIRINPETGTVSDGMLWYEENLPPETILYSILFAGNVRMDSSRKQSEVSFATDEDVMNFMKEESNFPSVFQLGGNSTLGRGMLRRIWI